MQVKYDKNAGEILEIYDTPPGRTDAIAMQHDVDDSICKDDNKCKHRADKKNGPSSLCSNLEREAMGSLAG